MLINAATKKESVYQGLLDEHQRRLGRVLNRIEIEAIGLANALEVEGGLLVSSQANLDLAIKARSDLVAIFEREYNLGYITPTVREFDEMAVGAKSYLNTVGINVPFDATDSAMINALKQGAFVNLDVLGKEFQGQLADSIYQTTLGNGSFTDLVTEIKGTLTDIEDVAGRPMSARAEQIAHDALINIDRNVIAKKSEEAGIEQYQYFGSVVAGTRKFCADHAGEVRTKEEWDELGQGDWQGKSSSDLFATAGGYNCGHTLIPVPNEEL